MVKRAFEGGEGFRGAHGGEAFGSGLAHGEEGVFPEDLTEVFEGNLVLLLAQLLDGEETADHVGLVRELGEEHLLTGIEVDFGENGDLGVEAHDPGGGREGKVEVLALLGDLDGA